ncbi:hypothetical protein XENOCAPTIV_006292 [Xenoophorus captivus]|uniref:Uncharacterized protein n=1 Tax=Xenoophorus captivus TaxID=1517983 RepID=A0ABV0QWB3_9TELE
MYNLSSNRFLKCLEPRGYNYYSCKKFNKVYDSGDFHNVSVMFGRQANPQHYRYATVLNSKHEALSHIFIQFLTTYPLRVIVAKNIILSCSNIASLSCYVC